MIDALFDDGAINIVGAEAERDLRHARSHHHPIGLDVGDVVEHQARHRDVADVGEAGGLTDVLERRIVGMEGQRDEGDEAAGFILQGAQLDQVIDAVRVVLNVAVEHGAIGAQAELVRGARGFDPIVAIDLVIANDASDGWREDFGAAAGQRIHAGIAQALQGFADADLRAARQICDLDHGERFQMDVGEARLEAAQHLAIPIEGQLGMQTTHDVELGDRFGVTFARALPDLFDRHGVGFGIAHALAEGAEAATGDADIGGIDMAVDVEIGGIAVQALADQVSQVAYG